MLFTAWTRWEERDSFRGTELPGIYLLAHFRSAPRGRANPLAKEIVYIGETCSTLCRRWYQFDRSAFRLKDGHSGGWTYREHYPRRRHHLYVAAFTVHGVDTAVQPYFIRYIERKLLWDYIRKWGKPPKCNRK